MRMIIPLTGGSQDGCERFNMTAVIDIVFLLIIFFMLVCQFIAAENFEVAVPDDIASAQSEETGGEQMTTVTVMLGGDDEVDYAVGSEKIETKNAVDISHAIAAEIDRQLQNLSSRRRVVCLRVDKDVRFVDSRYALAGVSQSTATDMKLAVIKQKTMPYYSN